MPARKLRRSFFGLVSLAALAIAACAPSSTGSDGDPPGGADGDGHDGGLGSDAGNGGGGRDSGFGEDPTSTQCRTGDLCEGDGICAGGVCCAAERACGDSCCSAGDICSFQKCETPGGECTDSSDCAEDSYCEFSLGTPTDTTSQDVESEDDGDEVCKGGAEIASGRCLPRPPECAEGSDEASDGPLTCLHACEVRPDFADFDPVLKYSWGGATAAPWSSDVMMTPIVIQLDDDDCDGKITERDIPEIVFSTFEGSSYKNAGTLQAISLIDGEFITKWEVSDIVNPTKQIAGGNIDNEPGNEIVACGADGKVYAFVGETGDVLWESETEHLCFMPQLADLDQDGNPEVIVEGGILDGATGKLKAAFETELIGPFILADIDGDGFLDIVTGSQGFHRDGTLFVDTGGLQPDASNRFGTSDWKGPWSAVADFDGDGKPEIVVVDSYNHALSVWRYDASAAGNFVIVREPVDINARFTDNPCTGKFGEDKGGGPPTIADFDGDGIPDVALAGGIGYVVFDGKRVVDPDIKNAEEAILWAEPTKDCSSATTGSTVFDFNGDGKAEVVYSDEEVLRIYEGATGEVLFETCNTTATLIENPVVADIDNDGHADIIVVSNAYGGQKCRLEEGQTERVLGPSGIRVFGSSEEGAWVRTRRVWNQHSYHVTNIEEDGTIPQHQLDNWKQAGLNNFRQNKQPGAEFAAPDATVSIAPRCTGAYGLIATVRNIGQAALPAGVVAKVFAGSPPSGALLGEVSTTRALYPAEAESLFLPLVDADPGITSGKTLVYATVEEPLPVRECRVDNNSSTPVQVNCHMPK